MPKALRPLKSANPKAKLGKNIRVNEPAFALLG